MQYGRNGSFLSALAAVSLMSITSRHESDSSLNTIMFHNSGVISRMLPATRQHELKYPSHGTRVVIRDLFGNIGVRVKQRVKMQENRTEQERAWLNLKRRIVELLLAWSIEVSLTFKDADTQREMKLRSQASEQRSRQFSLRYVQDVLVQSSYLSSYADKWIPLSAFAQSVSIKGAISGTPRPSKSVQFISIGILPITSTSNGAVVYDDINRIFDLSSFGTTEEEEEVSNSKEKRNLGLTTLSDTTFRKGQRDLDRWPMFCFNINVKETAGEFSSMKSDDFISDKQLQLISKVLNKAIVEWLSSQGYAVRVNRKRRHHHNPKDLEGSRISLAPERPLRSIQIHKADDVTTLFQKPSSGNRRSRMENSEFRQGFKRLNGVACSARSSRVAEHTSVSSTVNSENGNRAVLDESFSEIELTLSYAKDTARGSAVSEKVDTIVPVLSEPLVDGLVQSNTSWGKENCSEDKETDKISDRVLRWVDPVNGDVTLLDPYTGNALPTHGSVISSRPNSQRLSLRPNTGSSKSNLASRKNVEWIQDFLKTWKNPVYEPSGLRIPKACSSGLGNSTIPLSLSGNEDLGLTRLKRAALHSSNIIGQVDAKFILTTMQGTHSVSRSTAEYQQNARILVLVDQHAADERCKVEDLFAELYEQNSASKSAQASAQDCSIQIKFAQLMQPIRYEVSEEETRLFSMYSDKFSQWGISYEIASQHDGGSNTSQIIVIRTVPEVIAERCRSEPKLLIDLLRSEIWQLAGHGTKISLANEAVIDNDNTDHSWTQYLSFCPRGIIELINSRACRSAIMFNDVLSHVDCVTLIEKLARCSLPFQCAHGRPSMVPLIDLGWKEHSSISIVDNASNAFGRGEMKFGYRRKVNNKDDFVSAYKEWQMKIV